jgi:class 3 adenylate cyclase/alpha-beta hydrolase superfamily lysophospholipase
MERPHTGYVDVGGAEVAYQVVGQGPPDVVYVAGFGHVDLRWENPVWAGFLDGLASFGKLILFDRRGTGASDAVPDNAIPTWEQWTDDVRAVLDAAGSERAVVYAEGDGGPTGLLFTAIQPERVSGLILSNTSARFVRADEYPIGLAPGAVDELVEMLRSTWGTTDFVQTAVPSRVHDPEYVEYAAKITRAAATPRSAAAQIRYIIESLDAREALPLIQVPTLVLHARDNVVVPIKEGRYLASHIEGAKFVELPGGDIYAATSAGAIDDIAEFVTGERPPVEIDRILTTVLFIDIVGSTQLAASLGDHRWRELLASYHQAVRTLLRQFRGTEVDAAGDGFFATFDGPARAIRCGRGIVQAVEKFGLRVRTGLHTGEVELNNGEVSGLAVHIGARVGEAAGPNEILVTQTVTELVVGSGITFQDQGEHELKGVPGSWRLYRAVL